MRLLNNTLGRASCPLWRSSFPNGLRYDELYSAYSQKHNLVPSDNAPESAWKITLMCLGFTWLNPHVYLDTLIFLGSVSTQFSANIEAFTLGAVTASFVFFYSLGFGSRILIPVFENQEHGKYLRF